MVSRAFELPNPTLPSDLQASLGFRHGLRGLLKEIEHHGGGRPVKQAGKRIWSMTRSFFFFGQNRNDLLSFRHLKKLFAVQNKRVILRRRTRSDGDTSWSWSVRNAEGDTELRVQSATRPEHETDA